MSIDSWHLQNKRVKHSAGPMQFCIFQASTTVFNSLKGEQFDVHLYPKLSVSQKSVVLWKAPRQCEMGTQEPLAGYPLRDCP